MCSYYLRIPSHMWKGYKKKKMLGYTILATQEYTHIFWGMLEELHHLKFKPGTVLAEKRLMDTWTRKHILSRGIDRIIVYQTGKASYNVNDNFFFFFFFKFFLFCILFIFWPCWIFTDAHRLSLAVVSSALCTSTYNMQ